jgi:hypothetical protein
MMVLRRRQYREGDADQQNAEQNYSSDRHDLNVRC